MKLLKSNADIIKRLESVDFINVEMEKEQVEMNEKENAKCNQQCFKFYECEYSGGTKVCLMKYK